MEKWVNLLKTLPQKPSELQIFLEGPKDFVEFLSGPYGNLPEELRRKLERNLSTRKGSRFLDLLQGQPNPTIRFWALKLVTLLPVELRIPRLLAALGDRDEGIKLAATDALGSVRSIELVKRLIEGLYSGKWLPARIAQALSNMGDFALPEIIKMANSPEETIRLYCVEIMEQTRYPEAGEAILKMLRDPSARVRKRAAQAAYFFPEIFPGPELGYALRKEQDTQAKLQLIRTLGRLKVRFAKDMLLSYLENQDERIVRAARSAIESIDNSQERG